MKTCHSISIILLAFLSRVSAESLPREPVRVIATIPKEILLRNESRGGGLLEPRHSGVDGDTRPMKDVEVTGFITKDGDIYELSDSGGLGSIESRQVPEVEPGMSMCLYGTIVVYSDVDCKTFSRPSQSLREGGETNVEQTEEKPLRKKKTKRNRRRPNRNKAQKRRKNTRRKNPVRRKTLKRRGNKNRRRNPVNRKQKRRKTQPKKNERRRRRGNKKTIKRKRIDNIEERSYPGPMPFAILYDGQ